MEEAVALVRDLVAAIDEVCAGYPWREQWDGTTKSFVQAALGLTNHLRSPSTPGNTVEEGEKTLGQAVP